MTNEEAVDALRKGFAVGGDPAVVKPYNEALKLAIDALHAQAKADPELERRRVVALEAEVERLRGALSEIRYSGCKRDSETARQTLGDTHDD